MHETTEIGPNEIYLRAKIEYENILNNKTEWAILRSKTRIYEENEKSSKYFLSLEKRNAIQNTIRMLFGYHQDNQSGQPKDLNNQ